MATERTGRLGALSQEQIVVLMAALAFGVFSLLIPGFLSSDNVAALVRNVSVLGIIATGMAITIISRGIDLSLVASSTIAVAWLIVQLNAGVSPWLALPSAIAFCVLVGALNGLAIAWLEVPPIFTTLAMGTIVYGFGKYFLI